MSSRTSVRLILLKHKGPLTSDMFLCILNNELTYRVTKLPSKPIYITTMRQYKNTSLFLTAQAHRNPNVKI